jgi:hypothetical protein
MYRLALEGSLQEAGVNGLIGASPIDVSTIDASMASYSRVAADAKRDAIRLLDDFRKAQAAYHALTGRPESLLPVDPLTLFDSHDEKAGLQLVAEEYVLRFQNVNQQELDRLTGTLGVAYSRYAKAGGHANPDALAVLEKGKPMDAQAVLRAVETIRAGVKLTLQMVEDEDTRLGDYLDGLAPGSRELIGVDPAPERSKIEAIIVSSSERPPTLADTAATLDEVTALLRGRVEERRRNEEAVIVAALYPYARGAIDERLQREGRVKLGDLPYTPAAAHLYAQLYTRERPGISYDGDEEEISLG